MITINHIKPTTWWTAIGVFTLGLTILGLHSVWFWLGHLLIGGFVAAWAFGVSLAKNHPTPVRFGGSEVLVVVSSVSIGIDILILKTLFGV